MEQRFKVGDRVRCVRNYMEGEQFTAGKEYVVSYVEPGRVGVVADDEGEPNGITAVYFEPIVPAFKVGDRVRVIDNSGAPNHYEIGEVLTVESVKPAWGDDLIRCEGNAGGMYGKRFELVAPAFSVGDRIEFTNEVPKNFWFKEGERGTIAEVRAEEPYKYAIGVDGREVRHALAYAKPEYVRAIAAAPPAVAPAHPFKVGDHVQSKAFGAEYGTHIVSAIASPYSSGEPAVTYEGGGWDFAAEIELVPEAAEPAPPAFKIGDRVQAVGCDDFPGTIVGERDGELIVAWDLPVTWAASELYHVPATPELKPGVRVRVMAGAAAGAEAVIVGMNDNAVNVRTDDLYTDRAGQLMRHATVNRSNVILLQGVA